MPSNNTAELIGIQSSVYSWVVDMYGQGQNHVICMHVLLPHNLVPVMQHCCVSLYRSIVTRVDSDTYLPPPPPQWEGEGEGEEVFDVVEEIEELLKQVRHAGLNAD